VASDEDIVVVPDDHAAIARFELATELEHLLKQGVTPIIETITGLLATGKWGAAVVGGRVVQAALKVKLFEQVGKEIRDLRAKGKIGDDFAEKKYAFNSWVELFSVIDNEAPDEDRLEALKAMFYAVNKINTTSGDRIVAYQLFQLAKKLDSGQLLLLKAIHDTYKAGTWKRNGESVNATQWLNLTANKLGHGLSALVEQYERGLVDHGLISPRLISGHLQEVREQNARLTDLGIRFCENVDKYHIETQSDAGAGEAGNRQIG
jgi:hypothetical protein